MSLRSVKMNITNGGQAWLSVTIPQYVRKYGARCKNFMVSANIFYTFKKINIDNRECLIKEGQIFFLVCCMFFAWKFSNISIVWDSY